MKLNEIPKNEHVKRAIEVAAVGKHSLTLIGPYESEAPLFVEWVTWSEYPFPIKHVTKCPCGYFGSATRECTCSLPMVARHQSYWIKNQTDMYIEMPLLDATEIITFLKGTRKGEEDSVVYNRIKAAQKIKVPEMVWTDTDWNLLKSAISQLQLSYTQVQRIIKITESIYKLASIHQEPRFSTAYLAEAIQYRLRK